MIKKIMQNILVFSFLFPAYGIAKEQDSIQVHENQTVDQPSELKEEHGTKIGIIKIIERIQGNVEKLIRQIYTFSKNAEIKGILLIINSGGGNAGASELLFREIKQLARTKPVVALVIDSCCSGAYVAALGADWIIAPVSAAIGGIGSYVLIEKHKNARIHEPGYEADLEVHIRSAGKYKTMWHPNVPMNKQYYAELQKKADEDYKLFIALVARERNLLIKKHTEWADGQVFSGEQALEKLIDQNGGFSDALEKLKELMQSRGYIVDENLIFIEDKEQDDKQA